MISHYVIRYVQTSDVQTVPSRYIDHKYYSDELG